jgi:hypothetical protein
MRQDFAVDSKSWPPMPTGGADLGLTYWLTKA